MAHAILREPGDSDFKRLKSLGVNKFENAAHPSDELEVRIWVIASGNGYD